MHRLNPYLHVYPDRMYNPLNDRAIAAGDAAYAAILRFIDGGPAEPELLEADWVVPADRDLSREHYLKIVSLETMTNCNQKCYFCPVSIAPREDEEMPTELFDRIVAQLIP
ncbi:MAG TPA: hypothetical protein VFT12_02270, partial [Thermoanaerobaculia bacterium]|nr:hypothetical protein [Thermoanaerobaculia bacterium]